MKKAAILVLCFMSTFLMAQTNADRAKELSGMVELKDTSGWQFGAGLGLDFMQLSQINPKVGAGEDRVQFGGLSTIFANYKKGRLNWNNNGTLLLGVQRIGSGTININNRTIDQPFEKTIDELRLVSNVGYRVSDSSKWAYSLDFTFLSQITPTYRGNYLKDITESGLGPIAKFFSPAQITLAPGISYTPNENLKFIFSPISSKAIVVLDDDIASIAGDSANQIGLHGTEWRSSTDFDNVLYQFGASLRTLYQNKFWNDRLIYKSELTLFSNYLMEPQNIDVDWRNEFAIEIFKGLQLSFILNAFYDHDILVQVSDQDEPNGIAQNPDGTPKLGRRWNVVQTLALKYNYIF